MDRWRLLPQPMPRREHNGSHFRGTVAHADEGKFIRLVETCEKTVHSLHKCKRSTKHCILLFHYYYYDCCQNHHQRHHHYSLLSLLLFSLQLIILRRNLGIMIIITATTTTTTDCIALSVSCARHRHSSVSMKGVVSVLDQFGVDSLRYTASVLSKHLFHTSGNAECGWYQADLWWRIFIYCILTRGSGLRKVHVCVCVRVRACVRACVCVCVCACV